MSESTRELLELTQELLDSIREGDWDKYQALCDPSMTAIEPEACGHLIEGMQFHRFYFEQGGHMGPHNSTLVSPFVRMLGENVAVVSYVRLVQRADDKGVTTTDSFEETRVWHRQDGQWRHMHFHRSRA